MSKIVRFPETGDAGVLKLEDIPLEEPKDNEVRILVRAIALSVASTHISATKDKR